MLIVPFVLVVQDEVINHLASFLRVIFHRAEYPTRPFTFLLYYAQFDTEILSSKDFGIMVSTFRGHMMTTGLPLVVMDHSKFWYKSKIHVQPYTFLRYLFSVLNFN